VHCHSDVCLRCCGPLCAPLSLCVCGGVHLMSGAGVHGYSPLLSRTPARVVALRVFAVACARRVLRGLGRRPDTRCTPRTVIVVLAVTSGVLGSGCGSVTPACLSPPLQLTVMTVKVSDEAGDVAADQAKLEALRRSLGARLATYRTAARVSQPQLGRALGRTRSMISKIEHGTRGLPTALWRIADDLCRAEGVLVAEHSVLAQAEQDYRDRSRTHRRHTQEQQTGAQVLSAWPVLVSPAVLLRNSDDVWPQTTLVSLSGGCGKLAEELMAVVTRLVRSLGRRDAIRLAGSVLAAAGLSDLDTDEYTRLAQAVESPRRVDAQVVQNLAAMLAYCKRLEDKLGPCQVFDTVVAQHRLVHRLLDEDNCPEQLRRPLSLVDSNIACALGGYLVGMGHPEEGRGYFEHARKAAHDAANPVCAAYAAANISFAAFERADTPTALDSAAAARSLAARTNDPHLKAFAEQMAAGAYALDGQYGPCMLACDRAHDFLTTANGNTPESPAYWVHHGSIDSGRGRLLSRLGKPQEALDAATTALAQYDPTYVGRYTLCQVRLGYALILSKDITQAARVLGDAAAQAHLYPRLTAELHTARALMQPWENTHVVTTLDAQLEACGLLPPRQAKSTTPGSVAHRDQRA
jgi:transcriptional regulator with XRE-family HTH domain/tetratricopeptide (TPR) repeat protein